MKTKTEIEEGLNDVLENKDALIARYPGMSYADGLEWALNWILGNEETLVDKSDLE